jgi:hypothetical protein
MSGERYGAGLLASAAGRGEHSAPGDGTRGSPPRGGEGHPPDQGVAPVLRRITMSSTSVFRPIRSWTTIGSGESHHRLMASMSACDRGRLPNVPTWSDISDSSALIWRIERLSFCASGNTASKREVWLS